MFDQSETAHAAADEAVVNAMSAVAIINTRAVSSNESSWLALNRQRAKRGKPPLMDYQTVSIRKGVIRQMRAEPSCADYGGVQLHLRRGHFKTRKTGLLWWSPHLAGRKELGMVEKHYVA